MKSASYAQLAPMLSCFIGSNGEPEEPAESGELKREKEASLLRFAICLSPFAYRLLPITNANK